MSNTILIDIDKIVVDDRIRKDFGDLDELAEDIGQNGLINPPVVNNDYRLIDGERRLRACKLLGWSQIEVRMMDTRDAVHELAIEISANEVRKQFTKTEQLDYARRLARIESIKAKEHQQLGRSGLSEDGPIRVRESVARKIGVSGTVYRQMCFIEEHKDVLNPDEFDSWNIGHLSTNKAYSKVREHLIRRKQTEMVNVGASLKAEDVRRIFSSPSNTKRTPCFICGKHEPITELHHVVEVNLVKDLINKGQVNIATARIPVVYLCPNCHTYVHAILRGDFDSADEVLKDISWRDKYHTLASRRIEFFNSFVDTSVVSEDGDSC